MTRAVLVGECMVELAARPDGSYVRAFAGDAYNTAVHLKRSAPDIEVQFATVTGDDELSAAMRTAWCGEGIDDALAACAPGLSPGLYIVETDTAGERRMTYWRGQSAARGWVLALEARADAIAGADLLFMTGVSLAILPPDHRARAMALVDRLRPSIGLCAFDPNVRASLWESETVMREICESTIGRADVVLPSLEDAERLWGVAGAEAQVRRALALGAREVALTLGSEGCLVASAAGPVSRLAAQPAAVIDSAGAGDAFDGAYLATRLQGQPPEAAARAGLALAARVIGRRGALPSVDRLVGGTA
ncbi:MAG TPA: sugar kinase [Caulobacteraceae bacterium]